MSCNIQKLANPEAKRKKHLFPPCFSLPQNTAPYFAKAQKRLREFPHEADMLFTWAFQKSPLMRVVALQKRPVIFNY